MPRGSLNQSASFSPEKVAMTIADQWTRIRRWHDENSSKGHFRLNSGASESENESVESIIGLALPKDFIKSYREHNGCGTFLYYGELLSLTAILDSWRRYAKWQQANEWGGADWQPVQLKDERVKQIWWNSKRIPLTAYEDPAFLDCDPMESGCFGQILEYNHEVGPCKVAATGFAEWIMQIADELESGRFAYSEEDGQVQPVDW